MAMPVVQLKQTVQHIRRLVGGDTNALSDRQLLGRFVASKDDAAFAALVDRHAAMVLGVCRRVLAHNQDAEDACQAAFLVLARKAGSIRKGNSLHCWLHGAAFRVASNLRRQRSRRPADPLVEPVTISEDISWREVQRILDEELLRLPEQFRLPLLLCYLEGKTRDEAAEELDWSASTFRGRLVRGRERLRKRLEARGVGLTAGLLAAMVSQIGELSAVPPALTDSLRHLAAGSSSEAIRLLAEGALRTMMPRAMKLILSVAVVAGICGIGMTLFHETKPTSALAVAAVTEEIQEPPASKDAPSKKEPPAKNETGAKPLTDKELTETAAKSRDAGIDWLKKNQREDGTWENTGISIAWPGGSTALAVTALIDSGMKANDPVLARALKYLRELKPTQTYTVALQTIALCRLNDKKDAAVLARNVEWLEATAVIGPNANELKGWTYTKQKTNHSDFSNSQYALLALHEAGRAGIKPKNKKFWEDVRAMYLAVQLVDGGWPYNTPGGKSTFSMTCAGLCGMYLADDNIGIENKDSRDAKAKASIWLARKYGPFDGVSQFYNLHLLARLCKLSGSENIGDHNCHADGVLRLLQLQNGDGSFAGKNGVDGMKIISTSFAILFLNSVKEKRASRNDVDIEKYLAATADRIVLAKASSLPEDPLPGFETASLQVIRTLKGPHEKNLMLSMSNEGDKLPLGDGKEWIVFLRLAEEGQPTPTLTPFARKQWFICGDAETIKKVEKSIPLPEEWGREMGGLRLGMRLRQPRVEVGKEVAAEIVIQNVSEGELTILRHRHNIYDYWPHTHFEIAGPGRRLWFLETRAGRISEADHPKTQVLKPGECLIQAVRLDLWPARQLDSDTKRPNVFSEPGTFIIRGMYEQTQVKGPGFTRCKWRQTGSRGFQSQVMINEQLESLVICRLES
jgi:RNA polymerase sigma factor (sigma-70 family)